MIKCCLQPTESNVFFKKFHCRNEMFAISLRKSWQDFLHRNTFQSPVPCPSFHSCKIQSSSSNATLYTITSIIQDYTWNVSRFPNLFHFKSLLKLQSVCNFGTWDTTYFGFYKLWGGGYVPVLVGVYVCIVGAFFMWLPDCATLYSMICTKNFQI